MIIGIDPGRSGAVCVMNTKGQIVLTYTMPDSIGGLVEELRLYSYTSRDLYDEIHHVYLEKAQAMPKNWAVGMFNYGVGFGEILGMLAALKIPHTLIHPRTWTKVMHQGTKAGKPKERSLEAVRRLYPGYSLLASDKCKKPHEGIIDAILIAAFGLRQK